MYDDPDGPLCIHDPIKRLEMVDNFRVFVSSVLDLQGNAPLRRFSLKHRIGNRPSVVNRWIFRALDRGVLELDLTIDSEYVYPLPAMVLTTKTLVRLKLAGTDYFEVVVRDVCLPNLKTLHLSNVWLREGSQGTAVTCSKLITSCPALEDFVLFEDRWTSRGSYCFSNPSLKSMKIDCAGDPLENPQSVSFDAPNLLYLDLNDLVASKYPKVKFNSLVEARISIQMLPEELGDGIDNETAGQSAADLFMGICNVKTMYLSSKTLEILTFCSEKAIPFFNSLIQLTLETHQEVDLKPLPKLLKNCPHLETLVFEGLHYKEYSFKDANECIGSDLCLWLSSSPVKILKVLKFGEISDDKDDFERQRDLIEHFLETMPNLEQVILCCDTTFDVDVKALQSQLQMLKRVASNKCSVQVISETFSYSTTVSSSS